MRLQFPVMIRFGRKARIYLTICLAVMVYTSHKANGHWVKDIQNKSPYALMNEPLKALWQQENIIHKNSKNS